jgi:SsrA-binding protein
MSTEVPVKVVATNRRASFEYTLTDRYEAGLVLNGGEIKSIRAGKLDLRDAYVVVRAGEAWLLNMHVSPYELATGFSKPGDERRERKLLLNRKEIGQLARHIDQKGFTVVPTRVYLKRGRAKIEIALARGKRLYDKRQSIAKRDAERDVEREVRRGLRD